MAARSTPLVIALTGPIGSGVTTLSHVLAAHGFHRASLSEPIKAAFRKEKNLPATADVKTIPGWRKGLQDVGDEGRAQSPTMWLDIALKTCPADAPLVIDAVRNELEAEALRDRYTNVFLVAVVADKPVRYERSKRDYATEREFDEADERDNEDKDERPHGQLVGRCVNAADYVLINNKDLGATANQKTGLWNYIETDIKVMQGAAARGPRVEEVYMAIAYTASHLSLCKKRYVGSVIVGADGLPMSVGFNENPQPIKPCDQEWGYCFKDNAMEKELEERKEGYCTKCGTLNTFPNAKWRCVKCGEGLKKQLFPSRNMEKCTAIHAEERAIRGLYGRSAEGGTMYVTTFPCMQCARYILDARLDQVFYVEAYPVKEAKTFLTEHRVKVAPFGGFKARAFNIVFKPVS